MNFFITGGCGFIAKNLIKYLKGKGHSFVVFDNYKTGRFEDLQYTGLLATEGLEDQVLWSPESIVCIKGDILDPEAVIRASHGADVVIHLAANTGVLPSVEDPRGDCYTNVVGTLNVLEACRKTGIARFVFASSGAPVGDENPPPIHEKLPPKPVSPYGASKLAGEGYCSAYFRSYGIETVVLRFGNVYGPGSTHKGSVVAKFIKRAMLGEELEVYGNGTQTRDFIYIEDLLEAILKAAITKDIGGQIFQIATSIETSINEMTEVLVRVFHDEGMPPVKLKYIEPQRGEVQRNFSDTTKAKTVLNWEATTELYQGLRRTVNFFNAESAHD